MYDPSTGVRLRERPTQQPRTRCRLPCIVKKGRRRVRARVLDVSAGGLCIVAPVRFQNRLTVQVVIDDPRQGPIEVEAVVWHHRRFKQPSSGRKGFATGMVLSKGGPDFQALANPGSSFEKPAHALDALGSEPVPDVASDDLLDLDAPSVYRVRVKAIGTPRIKTLTLAAASEDAVREAVLSDLQGDWEILEVEADPLE